MEKNDIFKLPIIVFTMTAKLLHTHWLIFIVNKTDTYIYNLCISKSLIYATFCETSICHFLTNRKSPFFPLANKRARQVINLFMSD